MSEMMCPLRAWNVPPLNDHDSSRPSGVRTQMRSVRDVDAVVWVCPGVKWISLPTWYAWPCVVVVWYVVATVVSFSITTPDDVSTAYSTPPGSVTTRIDSGIGDTPAGGGSGSARPDGEPIEFLRSRRETSAAAARPARTNGSARTHAALIMSSVTSPETIGADAVPGWP